jgi:hypothetical protein
VKRLVALIAAALGLTIALSGCEVTQIDWRNHFYVLSQQSCDTASSVTVKNGTAILPGPPPYYSGESLLPRRVDVLKTVFGDMTGDGVNDVAVLLRCSSIPGPHIAASTGYEIQVFTRDGKPVARALPPAGAGFGLRAARYVPSEMSYVTSGPHAGHLVTGVISYASNDPQCCPSIHDNYVWYWWPHSPLSRGTDGFVGIVWTINGP